MSRILSATALSVLLLASGAARGADRTVTLAVDGMTCASCPYIVRTVLQEVPGVARVDVSYAEKTAVVAFDDAKATVAILTQATAGVGFPSRLAQ
jgi:periplasmic mercuric ion binding protein